jgi:cytidine deaminase
MNTERTGTERMNTDPATEAIPWDALRAEARAATKRSYAPYSNFSVGAAAITTDGRIVTGSNVENASYGLSLCAECSLVSDLVRTGGGQLRAVAVVSGSGVPCIPCGRCRQLLFEHGGPDCLVEGDGQIRTVDELLPGGFGPERIAEG